MPAVTQVVFYDDVSWPERAEADEVVRVTITRQPVAGGEPARRTTELYLTAARAAELDKSLDHWFERGHRPGKPEAPARTRRKYLEDVRRYADAHGLKTKDGKRPVYESPGGSFNYPDSLLARFDAWEAAGCPPPARDRAA
jgi:hypothetical protein